MLSHASLAEYRYKCTKTGVSEAVYFYRAWDRGGAAQCSLVNNSVIMSALSCVSRCWANN